MVTIWSPLMMDGDHATMVLYGIGQLDASGYDQAVNRLNELNTKWKDQPVFWDAVYFHQSLGTDYAIQHYPVEYWDQGSEKGQIALKRFKAAVEYLRPK